MVEHLKQMFSFDTRLPILHVHCDYKERVQQGVVKLMSSFVKQAALHLRTSAGIPKDVIDAYVEHAHGETSLDLQELRVLLIKLLKCFRRSFLIIDALDEYVPSDGDAYSPETVEIFNEVRKVASTCQGSCRLFVTSREQWLAPYEGVPAKRVEIIAKDKDISSYVKSFIQGDQFPRRFREKIRKDPDFLAETVDSLTRNARGQ